MPPPGQPPMLPGPHHCAASAVSVTEMIFRFLTSRCQSNGGTLSARDIDAARQHFLESFPNAFSFFETINQRCMEASVASVPLLFSRGKILATVLLAVAQKAARSAFPNQITRFGPQWLDQMFGGFAACIRQNVCPTADDRLMKAYAAVSQKTGAKLTLNDLLAEEATQRLVRECLAPFLAADAPVVMSAKVSDIVSTHIASERGIPKPDLSKVTEQEMKAFLTWLPSQVNISLTAVGAGGPAAKPVAAARPAT
jgi:hypothetical protein